MANPYYVDPFGGVNVGQIYGQALTGIGQALGQRRQLQQEQQKKNEAIGAIREAVNSGDNEKIADTMLQYPEYSKLISDQIGFRSDATKQNMIGGMQKILSNPADTERILTERIQMVESEGGDASGTRRELELYRQDPEGYIPHVELGYALLDPAGSKAYQAAKPKSSKDDLTTIQRNFNQYQELKRTDPIAAEQFGMSAGFVKGGDNRLFKVSERDDGSVVKYYSDGTEEVVPPTGTVKKKGMTAEINQEKAGKIMSGAKEYQVKSAGFALRLRDSIDNMAKLESEGVDPGRAALINKALGDGTITNMTLSPSEQEYMINAKDALFAILRPETGAAITDQELSQYSKIYLPQPGDSKKATAAKTRKLEKQYSSLKNRNPSVYNAMVALDAKGPTSEPGNGETQDAQEAVIIEGHPMYGNITEADIQETMKANNLTREQVIQQLGGQ